MKILVIVLVLGFVNLVYGATSLDDQAFVHSLVPNSTIHPIQTWCNDHLFIVKKPDGSIWLYQVKKPSRGKRHAVKTLVFHGLQSNISTQKE